MAPRRGLKRLVNPAAAPASAAPAPASTDADAVCVRLAGCFPRFRIEHALASEAKRVMQELAPA